MSDTKKLNIKEFRDMGLLQEVNRLFFHPLGLALSVSADDNDEFKLDEIWDYRDDPEGIIFDYANRDDESIKEAVAKANKVHAFMTKKHMTRNATLGFVVEPIAKKCDDNKDV